MTRKLKTYPEEFKRELVALYEAGAGTVTELEREYDVGRTNLYRWIRKYGEQEAGESAGQREAGESAGQREACEAQARIRELEREVLVLRQERDILKKAAAIFAHPKRSDSSSKL